MSKVPEEMETTSPPMESKQLGGVKKDETEKNSEVKKGENFKKRLKTMAHPTERCLTCKLDKLTITSGQTDPWAIWAETKKLPVESVHSSEGPKRIEQQQQLKRKRKEDEQESIREEREKNQPVRTANF